MNNKERYRRHCAEETTIPVFSRGWWLDTVCGENNWDVAIVERDGQVIGSMPYYFKKRMGLALLTQPPLTQTLGPWIRPSNAGYAKRLAYQKDVMTALIEQLPAFDYFSQNWHYSIDNWLPFYWKGFTQTTYYTYLLSDIKDEKKLWEGLEARVRTDIKKAGERFSLHVRDDLKAEDFFKLMQKSFGRQKMGLPFTEDLVLRLDKECQDRSCRKIWIAEDSEGRHHAGAYIIWDKNSAYYLMGGGDPELRNSGAASLVLWEAIRQASKVTSKFDFEGSMNESIERFFRGFGGKQEHGFNLIKINSKLFHIREFLLNIKGR